MILVTGAPAHVNFQSPLDPGLLHVGIRGKAFDIEVPAGSYSVEGLAVMLELPTDSELWFESAMERSH